MDVNVEAMTQEELVAFIRDNQVPCPGCGKSDFTDIRKFNLMFKTHQGVTEDSASQMADFALSGQTVAQQISMLAGLTAEDADAALQHILCTDRMATMYIQPDGTAQAAEEDEEEEG